MGAVQVFLLVLIVLVVLFGIGVVVTHRRGLIGDATTTRPQPPPREGDGNPPPILDQRDGATFAGGEREAVEGEPAPAALQERLAKARAIFTGAFSMVLGRSGISDESFENLEEALLRADIGVGVADELLGSLRRRVAAKEITEPQELLVALADDMKARLSGPDRDLAPVGHKMGEPDVWMFVGVNGVGKTTTIGKLSKQQFDAGHSVLLAAGDTFRAAAAEQLDTWAKRSNAEFVRGSGGGDPSSVIFDGVESAAAKNIDLVLADTAGRLHTKSNLMDELRKVRRVAEKAAGTVTETLLVIDATTGQNGLSQAREFNEAIDVTGVVLTKLDGSAKGGIVFAIETQLGIPVKLIGIGETIDDLIPFDPDGFIEAIFDDQPDAVEPT